MEVTFCVWTVTVRDTRALGSIAWSAGVFSVEGRSISRALIVLSEHLTGKCYSWCQRRLWARYFWHLNRSSAVLSFCLCRDLPAICRELNLNSTHFLSLCKQVRAELIGRGWEDMTKHYFKSHYYWLFKVILVFPGPNTLQLEPVMAEVYSICKDHQYAMAYQSQLCHFLRLSLPRHDLVLFNSAPNPGR